MQISAFLVSVLLVPAAHAVTSNHAEDGVCTAEHYDVADGCFTDEQLDWLGRILDFVHTPELD